MNAGVYIVGRAANMAAADGSIPDTMLTAELRSPRVGAINPQARMVAHALRQCLEGKSRPANERVGLSLGTASGANTTVQRSLTTAHDAGFSDVPASWYATGLPNSTSGVAASLEQLLGPNLTLLGYQSGLEAIIMACRLIRAGQADYMLAGGFDTPAAGIATQLSGEPKTITAIPRTSGVGLFLLAASPNGEDALGTIVGWSSDAANAASEDELVGMALQAAGRKAGLSEVHKITLSTHDLAADVMAASGPIRMIQVLTEAAQGGLHAFIAREPGEKAVCVLVDIPHRTGRGKGTEDTT